MQKVNIAFCFDKNLWKHFCVALSSLLNVSKGKCSYNIYAVVSNDITSSMTKYISGLVKQLDSSSVITFLYADKDLDILANKKEVGFYLRLQIPKLLPDIDKIIYCDIDVVFNDELSSLYNIDMKDTLLYGAKDGLNLKRPWKRKMIKTFANKVKRGDYINAGIVLINLNLMKKEKIYTKLLENLQFTFNYRDQDILNLVCRNRIKFLPLKYNFTPRSTHKYHKMINEGILTKQEFNEAKNNGIIYHFINYNPWNKLTKCADMWWSYARHTEFYNDFKQTFFQKASLFQKIKFMLMERRFRRSKHA